MFTERTLDYSSFLRLDNAQVLEYLTSIAGALAKAEIVGPREIDNLRMAVSLLQSEPIDQKYPALISLATQQTEFLATLEARFGKLGICLNLLRFSLGKAISELELTLSAWGDGLIQKAELFFNRPLAIYIGDTKEKEVLVSSVIVDLAAFIDKSCSTLNQLGNDLLTMHQSSLASAKEQYLNQDRDIAQATGFSAIGQEILPIAQEEILKRRLAEVLRNLADYASEVFCQLHRNHSHPVPTVKVPVLIDFLRAETQRLSELSLPRSETYDEWELRRHSILCSLASATGFIRSMHEEFLELLRPAESFSYRESFAPPKDVYRQLACDLMAQGVAPFKAHEAAMGLLAYIAEQGVPAKEILVGELSRISPHLTTESLETVQKLATPEALDRTPTAEKAKLHKRTQNLRQEFKRRLGELASLIVFFLASSCGLKTLPVSAIPDYQPEIPFRDGAKAVIPAPSAVEQKLPTTDGKTPQALPPLLNKSYEDERK